MEMYLSISQTFQRLVLHAIVSLSIEVCFSQIIYYITQCEVSHQWLALVAGFEPQTLDPWVK